MGVVVRLALSLVVLILVAIPRGAQPMASAQSERMVTATARCLETGSDGHPEVEVRLTNQTGAPLIVSYVRGYTTGQAFVPRMRMVVPEPAPPVVVADGETATVTAPWDDLDDRPTAIGGALVVTSAGALVPACSDRSADADEVHLGPAPASAAEARREAVAITVEMLGRLESWRAYPALYQLLHPDAQTQVSFPALACWYAAQFGLPDEPLVNLVFGNHVDEVAFGPWTWAVTGETYPDAAEVAYTTKVGTIAAAEDIASTMHLVASEGQWRWFFGTNQEGLAALPTNCGLT